MRRFFAAILGLLLTAAPAAACPMRMCRSAAVVIPPSGDAGLPATVAAQMGSPTPAGFGGIYLGCSIISVAACNLVIDSQSGPVANAFRISSLGVEGEFNLLVPAGATPTSHGTANLGPGGYLTTGAYSVSVRDTISGATGVVTPTVVSGIWSWRGRNHVDSNTSSQIQSIVQRTTAPTIAKGDQLVMRAGSVFNPDDGDWSVKPPYNGSFPWPTFIQSRDPAQRVTITCETHDTSVDADGWPNYNHPCKMGRLSIDHGSAASPKFSPGIGNRDDGITYDYMQFYTTASFIATFVNYAGVDGGYGISVFHSKFTNPILAFGTSAACIPVASTFTGSISGTTLTVTAVSVGQVALDQGIYIGGVQQTALDGGVTTAVRIGPQLTGTQNGVGTYTVFPSTTIASSTMTNPGGLVSGNYNSHVLGSATYRPLPGCPAVSPQSIAATQRGGYFENNRIETMSNVLKIQGTTAETTYINDNYVKQFSGDAFQMAGPNVEFNRNFGTDVIHISLAVHGDWFQHLGILASSYPDGTVFDHFTIHDNAIFRGNLVDLYTGAADSGGDLNSCYFFSDTDAGHGFLFTNFTYHGNVCGSTGVYAPDLGFGDHPVFEFSVTASDVTSAFGPFAGNAGLNLSGDTCNATLNYNAFNYRTVQSGCAITLTPAVQGLAQSGSSYNAAFAAYNRNPRNWTQMCQAYTPRRGVAVASGGMMNPDGTYLGKYFPTKDGDNDGCGELNDGTVFVP